MAPANPQRTTTLDAAAGTSAHRCTADEQGAEALPRHVLDRLVREYHVLARDNPKMAVATVAIKTLTALISQSEASTMMGLEKEIKEAATALQRCGLAASGACPARHCCPVFADGGTCICVYAHFRPALQCGCRSCCRVHGHRRHVLLGHMTATDAAASRLQPMRLRPQAAAIS